MPKMTGVARHLQQVKEASTQHGPIQKMGS